LEAANPLPLIVHPDPASPSTITVLVAGLAVDDGQAARPVVEERRGYFLTFHEVHTIFIDSGLYGEARWVDTRASGAPEDEDPTRSLWPTTLSGPGWAANWLANRPVHGATRLLRVLRRRDLLRLADPRQRHHYRGPRELGRPRTGDPPN